MPAEPIYSEAQYRRAQAFVLKALRRKNGVSQEVMAEAADLSRTHYALLELAKHTVGPYYLSRIATFHGTTLRALCERIERRAEWLARRRSAG